MKTGGDDERLKGKFYWPCDHYSVPADNLCFDTPPSPNADCRCIRPDGHPGRHQYEWQPCIRDYSHKTGPQHDEHVKDWAFAKANGGLSWHKRADQMLQAVEFSKSSAQQATHTVAATMN